MPPRFEAVIPPDIFFPWSRVSLGLFLVLAPAMAATNHGNAPVRVRIWQDRPTAAVWRSAGLSMRSNGVVVAGETHAYAKGVAIFDTKRKIDLGHGSFTGRFLVQKTGAEVRLINVVDLEAYLPGVLRGEISPGWPMEAQKAQAVAARSFARATLTRTSNQPYDLDGTPYSQVFLGTVDNPETCRKAVAETRGEILTYKGKVVPGYFHAHSGGQTEEAQAVWPKVDDDVGYLKSVSSPWSKEAPGYEWTTNISRRDLARVFTNGKGQGATGWTVAKWSPSKRAQSIDLQFPDGHREIEGNAFRLAVGAIRLPSLLFTVKAKGDGWTLEGHGFGHGVGLCQWSANIMAGKGYGYRAILAHFYTGALVAKEATP